MTSGSNEWGLVRAEDLLLLQHRCRVGTSVRRRLQRVAIGAALLVGAVGFAANDANAATSVEVPPVPTVSASPTAPAPPVPTVPAPPAAPVTIPAIEVPVDVSVPAIPPVQPPAVPAVHPRPSSRVGVVPVVNSPAPPPEIPQRAAPRVQTHTPAVASDARAPSQDPRLSTSEPVQTAVAAVERSREETRSEQARKASARPAPRSAPRPPSPRHLPQRPLQADGSAAWAGGNAPSLLVSGIAALIGYFALAAPIVGRRIRPAWELSPRSRYRARIDHPG
jgi:hypothetical protein